MTKQKSTKRALLLSALSLLMCVSMLIGSTFAWFTDSVTSSGNIIKSGTLDVEMYWAKGNEDPAADTTVWTDASTGAIFNNDKWEPGYTEVRHIKIANEGTLALKYQLHIAANGDVSELADVIDVYFVDPAAQVTDRTDLSGVTPVGTLAEVLKGMPGNASGDLLAEETDTVTLALKMRESAGNEYQNKEIGSDFIIQLLATQLTSESDSFDDQYDANAEFYEVNERVSITNNDGKLGEAVVLTADMPYGTLKVTVPAGAQLSSADVTDLKLTVKKADVLERISSRLLENQVAYSYEIYVDGIADDINPYILVDGRTAYNYEDLTIELPVGVGRNDLSVYANTSTASSVNYDIDTGIVTFEEDRFTTKYNNYPNVEKSVFTVVYTKLTESEKLLNAAIEQLTSGGSVSITSTADNMVSLNNIADALDGKSNVILVGSGTDNTVVASTGAVIEADGLAVKDMSIQAMASYGLQVNGDGTSVDNIDFTFLSGNYGFTITGSDSTITDSTMRGNGNNILMFANNSDTTSSVTKVTGCTFENMEGWGNKGGLRFQNMNGKIEISDSTFNIAGTALDLGPINSTVRGNVEVSNSTVNTTGVRVSTVKSSSFDKVTFKNTWYETPMSFYLGGTTNTFTDCEFQSDISFLSANYGNKKVTVNLNNCTFNGVTITADNVFDHFDFNAATWGLNVRDKLTLVIDGTTVTVPNP